jgi:hypothetical protein
MTRENETTFVIGERKRPTCHLTHLPVVNDELDTAMMIRGPWQKGKRIDFDALAIDEPEAS